jgi:hypothetical protein
LKRHGNRRLGGVAIDDLIAVGSGADANDVAGLRELIRTPERPARVDRIAVAAGRVVARRRCVDRAGEALRCGGRKEDERRDERDYEGREPCQD